MVTIGMNYVALEGKEEAFKARFSVVIKALNEAEGHDKSVLYNDVTDKQSFLIVSQWNDKAAFDSFISSDDFKAVTNWGKEKILAGRPSHEVYQS
jgi:heme-degrading monooxygenase HmoA